MNDYDKAKKVSLEYLENAKRLYPNQITGLLGVLVCHYTCALSQDTIDGMKDALIEHFFDGIDPEWENEALYNWFEGLNPSWFEEKNNTIICNNPFKNSAE